MNLQQQQQQLTPQPPMTIGKRGRERTESSASVAQGRKYTVIFIPNPSERVDKGYSPQRVSYTTREIAVSVYEKLRGLFPNFVFPVDAPEGEMKHSGMQWTIFWEWVRFILFYFILSYFSTSRLRS